MAFGWGTNLTNDFSDSAPARNEALKAISLVCKVSSANGHQAVKTVRQCREGDRRSRRHRPLHPPVRRREPGEETGLRLISRPISARNRSRRCGCPRAPPARPDIAAISPAVSSKSKMSTFSLRRSGLVGARDRHERRPAARASGARSGPASCGDFRDAREHGLFTEKSAIAVQRAIGNHGHAGFSARSMDLRLVEIGMVFDLVCDQRLGTGLQRLGDMPRRESWRRRCALPGRPAWRARAPPSSRQAGCLGSASEQEAGRHGRGRAASGCLRPIAADRRRRDPSTTPWWSRRIRRATVRPSRIPCPTSASLPYMLAVSM